MAGLTKIESTGIANDVDFDGAGTLKLDSTNARVGVGITSPSHRLTVLRDNTAALKVGGNGSHVDGYHLELGQLGTNTSAGIKYTGSGGSMMFHNSSGEVARFRPDGELLLNHGAKHGTNARSSWYSWLHVKGNAIADTSDGRITLTSGASLSGTAAIGSIYFADLNGGDRAAIRGHQDGAGNSSDNFPGRLSFWTNSGTSNATEKMRIDSSGRVGIGCEPVRDLQLHTSDASSELMISNSTTGATAGSGFMIQQDGNDNYIWNKENSFMSFGTNAAEGMRLANSGELLLGTTTAPARGELLKVEKKPGGTQGAGIKLSGTYSLVDEGSQTFTIGNCALIFIAENNTGDGAMFFCTYKASAVSKVSDPHDRYANSDTDGKICVFKTAESHSVVLKNRCGATKSFTIGKINTSD